MFSSCFHPKARRRAKSVAESFLPFCKWYHDMLRLPVVRGRPRMVSMKSLGRFLQVLGLILLPAAMLLELTRVLGPKFGVRDMLVMLIFGFAVFYSGRYLEGYGQRS